MTWSLASYTARGTRGLGVLREDGALVGPAGLERWPTSMDLLEDWPEAERKRHLLRLWLAPPAARPLPPVFAECYGGVAVGDRGGIICRGTRLHAPLVPG